VLQDEDIDESASIEQIPGCFTDAEVARLSRMAVGDRHEEALLPEQETEIHRLLSSGLVPAGGRRRKLTVGYGIPHGDFPGIFSVTPKGLELLRTLNQIVARFLHDRPAISYRYKAMRIVYPNEFAAVFT
jgi:hypothetical protein